MIADEIYWATTRATGSTRYALASSHPSGGCPSTNGNNQAVPDPAFWAATDVGPAKEGIQ